MMEINLYELQDWYLDALKDRFSRQHNIMAKYFKKSADEIAEIKNSLKSWKDKEPENAEQKLDDKTKRIMTRFADTMLKIIDKIKIPTYHNKISFENARKFVDGVNKAYQSYNRHGKKSLKRFWQQYKIEIKELEYHLRKLGKYSAKMNKFILKKYKKGKEAESLMDDIPTLEHRIERLGSSKTTIDEMDVQLTDMKKDLKSQEEELYKLGQHPTIQKLDELETKELRLTREFRNQLKFKKALKKLLKAIDNNNVTVHDINTRDIKKYLKSTVSGIINEGPKVPDLKQLLVRVRLILEDEEHPLNIKADLREKILENIHEIVNENLLEPYVNKLSKMRQEIKDLKKEIEKLGIENQRQDLKDKIATLTADVTHYENDLKHQKREYKSLLGKISTDRTELEEGIFEQVGEEVKIKIIIPT